MVGRMKKIAMKLATFHDSMQSAYMKKETDIKKRLNGI
jgi:hypothetical protein